MDFQQKDNSKLAMVDNNTKENKESDSFSSKGQFLVVKLDKLSTAVYLVTGFLSDKEPLKWDLRKLALKIVDHISEAKYGGDVLTGVLLNNANKDLVKIISLLSIGMNISGVSKMNFRVLKEEFENILNSLLRQDNFLSQIDNLPINPNLITEKSTREPIRQLEGREGFLSYRKGDISREEKIETKSKPADKPKSDRQIKEKDISVSSKKKGRQAIIIDYIKNHGWSSIADIASVDSDCSLKTIQRELSSLVEKGVLKKKGERRWSRYQTA